MKRNVLRVLAMLAAATLVPACDDGDTIVISSPTTGVVAVIHITPGGSGRTLTARGGVGSVAAGGNGAQIDVRNISGSDHFVLLDGSVDTSFAIPAPSLELGTNPRTILVNTTYTIGVAGLTTLAAGDTTILGDDGLTPATGLFIGTGATLTIPANLDNIGADGLYDGISLSFGQGTLIDGSFTVGRRDLVVAGDAGTLDAANLSLRSTGGVAIALGGLVDTRGTDTGAGSDGGLGGNLTLSAGGSILNRGSILATGGDGDNGGNGGAVTLVSDIWGVFNTGPVTSSGGNGGAGLGGNGGLIQILNSNNAGSFIGGGAFNGGDLTSTGGNGTTGGGNGGNIRRFDFDSDGPSVNSGALDASGGDATVAGNGGNAGDARFISSGGHLRFAGSVRTVGGQGAGAASTGGNGGVIDISGNTKNDQPSIIGTFIGADMDSSGGAGETGGNASTILLWNNTNFGGLFDQPGRSPMYLVGYASFDASGGNGATDGGDAGFCRARNETARDASGMPHYANMLNEVPFTARGGDGTTGAGGDGNIAVVEIVGTAATDAAPNVERTCVNRGAMDTRGGNGATFGGNGGFFFSYDRYNVQNYGDVVTSGGQGGSSAAGSAGSIRVIGDGDVVNEADLTADGGASTGTGNGGNGNTVIVQGKAARQTGDISARGGNSVGGTGGFGSPVELGSWNGFTLTSVSGTITVQFGTGVVDGGVGIVTLDGIRLDLTNGSITF